MLIDSKASTEERLAKQAKDSFEVRGMQRKPERRLQLDMTDSFGVDTPAIEIPKIILDSVKSKTCNKYYSK